MSRLLRSSVCNFADCTVVFGQPIFDVADMLKQIADAASDPARQCVQMGRDLSSQTLRVLRQHDAEFEEQAAHPVIGSRPPFNEPLPGPMRVKCRLLCARMDKPRANTAVAHKLARMVYFMLTRGEAFVDQGQQRYEEQQRQRSIAALRRRATALGFQLQPNPPTP
jgi:hypothetical protein